MNIYKDVSPVIGDLEFGVTVLETVILNGKNGKINRYLQNAIEDMKHALVALSDAEFEIYTTPDLDGEEEDEE